MSDAYDPFALHSDDPQLLSHTRQRLLTLLHHRVLSPSARLVARSPELTLESQVRRRLLAALHYRLTHGAPPAIARNEQAEAPLRQTILALCKEIGIFVFDSRRRALDAMSVGELEALRDKIKSERNW